ncbi:VirK/YbjX family protein [Vibrio aerogenes]|uniref:VirK/YbjX family protein n=1 Tax=Vibrio aerogenes TaxID=92172 RepID=UPI0039F0617E
MYDEDKGIKKIRKIVRFILFSLIKRHHFKALENLLFSDPNLSQSIPYISSVFEMSFMPYGCVTWSAKQRITARIHHYNLISQIFTTKTPLLLSPQGIDLLKLSDREGDVYTLNLFRGNIKEGSLGIRLYGGFGTIYSLSFTLFQEQDGRWTMHIGAVQGPRGDCSDRKACIKTLTRSFHGLRPKSFILETTLMLAREWNIDQVQAVSGKGHVYQALRYQSSKARKVKFDYDTFWEEHHAIRLNKHLFAVPLTLPRKEPDTLNRSKRKLYTKRYQFLDELNQQLHEALSGLTGYEPYKPCVPEPSLNPV